MEIRMGSLDLDQDEREIRGAWLAKDGKVVPDAACERIEWLTGKRLEKIATDSSGWDVLYRDPRDGRLWEKKYPHSDCHGGGPPMLVAISEATAESKYGVQIPESSGCPPFGR
jgi:hypothetical protein